MRLQNNNGQFKLTIPKDLATAKGWDHGTELVITMDSAGDLVIREIPKKKDAGERG